MNQDGCFPQPLAVMKPSTALKTSAVPKTTAGGPHEKAPVPGGAGARETAEAALDQNL